jgi:cysteinyl-tRNA synthetase
VDGLVRERWQARLNKDFKRSDELRDQLLKMGISVMDTQEGSSWEVAK